MSAVLQSFPANEVDNLLEFIDLFRSIGVSDKVIKLLLTHSSPEEDNLAEITFEKVLAKINKIGLAKGKKLNAFKRNEEKFWKEHVLDVWNSIKSKTPDHKVKELLQWSKRYSFLPQTLDAWLIWSGSLGKCLDELHILSTRKTHGDQALFARKFISEILPKIQDNPRYLIEYGGKDGVPKDVYDIYQKLGEGGVQVINYISSQIESQARSAEGVTKRVEQRTIRRRFRSSVGVDTHTRPLFPDSTNIPQTVIPSILTTPNYAQLRQSVATCTVGITDQKIARGFQLLRDNLSRRGISLKEISVGSLIINGFGSIIYSAIFTSTEFYRQYNELLDQILREINTRLE